MTYSILVQYHTDLDFITEQCAYVGATHSPRGELPYVAANQPCVGIAMAPRADWYVWRSFVSDVFGFGAVTSYDKILFLKSISM